MKKAIIAGAASAVLAAMPVMGAFASQKTTTITDTLTTTINTACSFTRKGAAGAGGQTNVSQGPAWNGTADTFDEATHVYSATLNPGATVELGTSSFKAYCNATNGFTVTVATPNLEKGGDAINFSGSEIASNASGWTLQKQDDTYVAESGATFMSADGETAESTAVEETATYTVKTLSTTPSGTYTGNVVYTFTYEDPNQN